MRYKVYVNFTMDEYMYGKILVSCWFYFVDVTINRTKQVWNLLNKYVIVSSFSCPYALHTVDGRIYLGKDMMHEKDRKATYTPLTRNTLIICSVVFRICEVRLGRT